MEETRKSWLKLPQRRRPVAGDPDNLLNFMRFLRGGLSELCPKKKWFGCPVGNCKSLERGVAIIAGVGPGRYNCCFSNPVVSRSHIPAFTSLKSHAESRPPPLDLH